MSIKRKYVDSHWLIFAFEGAVALLFGWFALFTNLTAFFLASASSNFLTFSDVHILTRLGVSPLSRH